MGSARPPAPGRLINVTFCASNKGNGESQAEAQAGKSGGGLLDSSLHSLEAHQVPKAVLHVLTQVDSVTSILQMRTLHFSVIGKGYVGHKWIVNPGRFLYKTRGINTVPSSLSSKMSLLKALLSVGSSEAGD